MSTALSESFQHVPKSNTQVAPPRHLEPVEDQQLTIRRLPSINPSSVQVPAGLGRSLQDPSEEFAPKQPVRVSIAQSNVVYLGRDKQHEVEDRRHQLQLEAIQKMTQTIGSAFVEAELGVRPFMQLSSWMELELFQKLRARVERTVNGKYLAAVTHGNNENTVPSIIPIGVRAAVRDNGEWETSMTIRVGQRARAIAMRLQLHRERWRVIAFEIG